MATATRARRRSRGRSSTNSLPVDPPELDQFAAFCGELKLDTQQAFVFEPFQRTILRDYFAGATETLVLLPKKNGKSTLVAALALYHLLTTQDAECYIVASSRKQAGIILKQARKFIKNSPQLDALFDVHKREIYFTRDEGVAQILASDVDTADGVIPTLAIVDELHRHKSADLYGVFRDGLGPRNGRIITISTAGDDESSPLGVMRANAYKLPTVKRDGPYRYCCSNDGAYAMHEWALDAKEDLDDLSVVVEANPASWQDEDALRLRHDSPTMTGWQWARFACGVWMRGGDAAVSPLDWAACGGDEVAIPRGETIDLGVDLGWKWDTTALVPLWFNGVEWIFDIPKVVVPPRDGTSTDPTVIETALRDIGKRWNVRRVVMDPNAGGEQLAAWIERELGWTVVTHSQDSTPMALAAERFTQTVRERALSHPQDPVFTSHVLAASPKTVAGEKWRFAKAPRSKKPIDALIAAAMVLSVTVAERNAPKRKPKFEVLA